MTNTDFNTKFMQRSVKQANFKPISTKIDSPHRLE